MFQVRQEGWNSCFYSEYAARPAHSLAKLSSNAGNMGKHVAWLCPQLTKHTCPSGLIHVVDTTAEGWRGRVTGVVDLRVFPV